MDKKAIRGTDTKESPADYCGILMTVSAFLDLAAIIVTLAALFGYVNHRWL